MRIISAILIFALFHLCLGCYNTKILYWDFEIRESLSEGNGVYHLQTKDSTEFDFINHTHKYVFQNDSLYSRAKRAPFELAQRFEDVRISVDNILWLETRELNNKWTLITGIGIYTALMFISLGTISRHPDRR